jgi:uncharacterized damage-inducible protein DinB
MSKLRFVAALLLAAGLCTLPAVAQQDAAKKTGPPTAAKGVAEALLEQWNGVGKKLIAMAEDFPEDKYDYKPTTTQRSFAEQLLHASGANYFFTNLAEGKPLPTEEDPPRSKYKSKAEVVAFVKKSFEDGAAVIKSKGDAGVQGMLVDPFENQKVRVFEMAYGLIEHSGEHYGQLVGYYRSSGMVPPESRPKK